MPFDLEIAYEMLVESPLLFDGYLSKGFDFQDFQNQDKLWIRTKRGIQLHCCQDVFTYFKRVVDLNFTYFDEFEPHF